MCAMTAVMPRVTGCALLVGTLALASACRDSASSAAAAVSEVSGTSTAAAPPARRTAQDGDVEPERLDRPGIEARGEIRVLVRADDPSFVPRGTEDPWGRNLAQAEAFARWLGVQPRFVLVSAHDELIPALLEGRGDLIASDLTVTDAREDQVAFARATRAVQEMLVGQADAEDLPASVEDLAGRSVHVRRSSAYFETLKQLEVEGLTVVEVPEHLDTPRILEEVASGERPLTVADRPIVDMVLSYEPRVKALFPLTEPRHVSWAVRPGSPKLRAAIDQFRTERALTRDVEPLFTGDLDEIRERGVLRVLTRNNPVTYFLYKGRPFGFEYELVKMLAESLGVRLQMVVPPDREALETWLLEGRGDLVAASLTVTRTREARVAFSRPYLYVDEVLVAPKGAKDVPTRLADLAGRAVHVRPSSSGWETLSHLRELGIGVELVPVAEDVETEGLLARVAAGEIDLTVADSHILDLEQTYGTRVEAVMTLPAVGTSTGTATSTSAVAMDGGGPRRPSDERPGLAIGFAMRPGSTELEAEVDAFVERIYRGRKYNIYKRRYFEDARRIRRYKKARVDRSGRISPYDDLIRSVASQYEFDWRLMAAQAYVESGFDPDAESWVGAQGLFQVMPRTGASLGYDDLADPVEGTRAGIKYMDRLLSRFDPELPFAERVWMALAAYNAGLGHVFDARRLAPRLGLDPNKWFDNVEKAMLALSKPKFARQARHGYVRGREPVAYVGSIREVYTAYQEATSPSALDQP